MPTRDDDLAESLGAAPEFVPPDEPTRPTPVPDPPASNVRTDPHIPRPRFDNIPTSSETLAPGTPVGGYEIQERIARGGFGAVYRAYHRILGRPVALKLLHSERARDGDTVQRFLREAQAVNQIRHPNIVDIHDVGVLPDGRPYLVMELLDGHNLEQIVRARGSLAQHEVVDIMTALCGALTSAHAHGIVHRDLKPQNVMLAKVGGTEVVKLLDFGVAKLLYPAAGLGSSVGAMIGSPWTMSPEQIRGDQVGPAADIYALGILLFWLLTGRYPFEGASGDVELAHLDTAAPRPSSIRQVSAAVDAVVLRCLEKKPEKRYASTEDLATDVRAALRPQRRSGTLAHKRALAIYLEVWTDAADDELDDEALLDDLDRVPELAAQVLTEREYMIAMRTGNALLATFALTKQGELEQRQRELHFAHDLYSRLLARAAPDPRVQIRVCVHVDLILVQANPEPEVTGGELMNLAAWVPAVRTAGVTASAAATATEL